MYLTSIPGASNILEHDITTGLWIEFVKLDALNGEMLSRMLFASNGELEVMHDLGEYELKLIARTCLLIYECNSFSLPISLKNERHY